MFKTELIIIIVKYYFILLLLNFIPAIFVVEIRHLTRAVPQQNFFFGLDINWKPIKYPIYLD